MTCASRILLIACALGCLPGAPVSAQSPQAWDDGFSHVMIGTDADLGLSHTLLPDNDGGLLLDADADGRLDVLVQDIVSSNLVQLLLLRNLGGGDFETLTAASFSGPDPFEARYLVEGDLNGDGHLDVVANDASGDVLAVLLGAGDGSFTTSVTPLVPQGRAPELADLDDDGVLDLLLFTGGVLPAYELQWRRGIGDGTFEPAVAVAAGLVAGNFGVTSTTGDLEGDGDLDAVVVASQLILVHLSSGGTLGAAQLVDSAPFGRFLRPILDDLDGDGDLDLVVCWTTVGQATVSRWPGLGNGSFGPRVDEVIFDEPLGAWTGDLDIDGHTDIVAFGRRNLFVMRGAGGFAFQNAAATPFAERVEAGRLGDLTGDGLLDLAVEQEEWPGLDIHVGLGNGGFEPLAALETAAVGAALRDVTVDGRADVALGFQDRIEVRPALPGGGFGPPLSSVAVDVLSWEPHFADLDGDGIADLIGRGPASQIGTLLNHGGGVFGSPWSLALTGSLSDLRLGDLDGDQVPDLVLRSNSVMRVLLGNGDGTLTQVAAPFPTAATGEHPALGDFDGDGNLDLAYTNLSQLVVFPGLGDGTFSTAVVSAPPVPFTPRALAVADIDGDGLADMLYATDQVYVRLGQGDGASFSELGPLPDTRDIQAVRLVDVDGDGHLDALVSLRAGGVRLHFGDGAGAFDDRGEGAFALRSATLGLALGDVDGDGDLDLVPNYGSNAHHEPIGVGAPLLFDQRRRWELRGSGIEGAAGHATLGGVGTLAAGDPVRVLLQSGLAGAPATLVISLSALDFPMLGGVLVPAPDILLAGLPIAADGTLDLPGTWPAGVPGDVEVFLQAWFPDGATPYGWAATPGLVMITP